MVTDRLPHPLRSDARDNRDRLLDAARTVFAEHGLDAPMRDVARRAGVGPATLYRHFPTKEVLVTEAFADQMRACEVIVGKGLADEDPWRGFRSMLEELCVLHAASLGFTAAFMSAYPKAMDFAAARARAMDALAELTARAKRTGHLRPDVVVDDVILLLMANSGVRTTSPAAATAAARRFAALAAQALRASRDTRPLPPPGQLAPLASLPRPSTEAAVPTPMGGFPVTDRPVS